MIIAATMSLLFTSFRSGVMERDLKQPSPESLIASHNSLQIIDQLPTGQGLLFSKDFSGDLWFRDESGHERYVASNVLRATFSPDGMKIAFDTSDNEIFIETIEGKKLAVLARASDHTWSSNSAAIVFSATASADYPQMEQSVTYNLTSEEVENRKAADSWRSPRREPHSPEVHVPSVCNTF